MWTIATGRPRPVPTASGHGVAPMTTVNKPAPARTDGRIPIHAVDRLAIGRPGAGGTGLL